MRMTMKSMLPMTIPAMVPALRGALASLPIAACVTDSAMVSDTARLQK